MTVESRSDFGWRDDAQLCSTRYILGPIRESCRRLGVRRILDLGCGNGSLAKELLRDGYEVTGCEPDEKGVEIARSTAPGGTFHVLGVYDDPALLGESGFDLVLSSEVIEHLYSPRRLLAFARSVLRPEGHLLLTTPYHGYLKNLALSLFDKWDGHHSPMRDGGHIKFWSRRTLEELLRSEGFAVTAFHGAGRLPYLWKSMVVLARLER